MPSIHVAGVDFHVVDRGTGTPIVLLHGFTGSSQSWKPVIDRLAGEFRVVAIDLIGHGQSSAPPDAARYVYERAIADFAWIAASIGIERATWLGYSLGGRLALGLALTRPDLVSALVLVSTSPGIRDDAERAQRRKADDLLAQRIERVGVERFVADWESLPMWESQRGLGADVLRQQREIRMGHQAIGLAHSLRGMGPGSQPSWWNRLHEVAMPVLLVSGALDTKFTSIAADMHAAMPTSRIEVVPGAGHAVHLEQPGVLVERVGEFVASCRGLAGTRG